MDSVLSTAIAWTATDPRACRGDVSRLGLDRAARYNLDMLLRDEAHDKRWAPLVAAPYDEALRVMRDALLRLA